MHTSVYEHDDEYNGNMEFRFHHNSNCSGDVEMIAEEKWVTFYEDVSRESRDGYYQIVIPFEVLRNFVLDRMRNDVISKLETASYEDFYSFLTAIGPPDGDR